MVVNEVVTRFGFEGSTQPLVKYNATLSDSISMLSAMVVGFNAAAAGVGYFMNSVLEGINPLSRMNNELGVSSKRLQTLAYVAEQTQSSQEALFSSLEGLQQTIGNAAQKGSDDFARLGISVRDASGEVKNVDTILDEVRNRFLALDLSMSERRSFAQALGIDASLVQLLSQTDSQILELEQRASRFGLLDDQDLKSVQEYDEAIKDVFFGINQLKNITAVGLAPEMKALANTFANLLERNKDWIINGVQFASLWIGNLADAFNRLIPFLIGGAVVLGVLKIATIGFGTALGIVLSPVVLITAGVVALLLIIDDLIVAFNGGNSVIKDFFAGFDIDIVKVLTVVFDELNKSLDLTIDVLKTVWGWLDYIGKSILAIPRMLGEALNVIKSTDIWKALSFVGNGVINLATETVSGYQKAVTQYERSIMSTTNNQLNQSNSILIQSSDPVRAGQSVVDSLERKAIQAGNAIPSAR